MLVQLNEERLQTRAVNHLHVDNKLTTVVTDDQNANAATTGVKGFVETIPEVGLIDDWKGLLDIAGLGHGNNWKQVRRIR